MKTEARHLIAEYWGCPFELLNDRAHLERVIRAASEAALCRVLSVSGHDFEPHGVTVMALLSESHASIHTWPEQGYAAVDVYTCGEGDPMDAHPVLVDGLRSTIHETKVLERGGRP